jgi:hypothetical protein
MHAPWARVPDCAHAKRARARAPAVDEDLGALGGGRSEANGGEDEGGVALVVDGVDVEAQLQQQRHAAARAEVPTRRGAVEGFGGSGSSRMDPNNLQIWYKRILSRDKKGGTVEINHVSLIIGT